MGVRDLINKFTSGELDPKFIAEVDYDGYRKAARKLRNVVATPQGGVQRRFGSFYQQVIMNGAAFITNPSQVRLIEYEHENQELYDIIIRPDTTNVVAFDIYLAGIFQVSVPAPAATYTAPDIFNIRWVKDYDRLFILLSSVRPYELRRIAANNWELNPITFVYFPTYDFTTSDDPATLPTPNVPYTDPSVTFTPNATAATTVTANMAVYTSNHVGGLYYGNAGIFRITAIDAGGTVATGFTYESFADTTAIIGPLSALLERAWNDGQAIAGAPAGINRGWPSRGTYYQSRLVLGGSPFLPGSASASIVRDPLNFSDAEADPDQGWTVEIGVSGNDVLTDILATKSLVLVSNKGAASTSILLDAPTTPTNAFVNTQGTEGSRNMDATIIDNQVIYADRAGNTIWSMSYEVPDTGYNIANASILSTQLIRNPIWGDIFDPDTIDGRYFLLANSDGSMAIYNTLKDENIRAWSLAQTIGSYSDVACVANQAKALVRRKVLTPATAGNIDGGYTVDSTFSAFRDITSSINNAAGTSVFITNGDYLLIGNEIEFTEIDVTFNVVSAQTINYSLEFLTNTGDWQFFTPTTDTTNGFRNNGSITWAQASLSNWEAQSITGTTTIYNELPNYYWIRLQRRNVSIFTTPIINTLFINTANRIYLEELSFNIYMDAQITVTSDASGNVSGLTHLIGQNVFMFANGFPIGTYYVPSTGIVATLSPSASIDVGLDYSPNVTPMPVIALLSNGYSVYEPAHIDSVYVDYYQTLGLTVQGQNVPDTIPGNFMTEATPVPYTGYYKVPGFGGWDARVEFVISQSYPAPMLLLGISYTIEVSP